MSLGVPGIDITAQRGPIETSETSETKGETEDVFITLYLRNGLITTLRRLKVKWAGLVFQVFLKWEKKEN